MFVSLNNNTMGATIGVEIAFPSEALEFTLSFFVAVFLLSL
jgi:hypothetical protein